MFADDQAGLCRVHDGHAKCLVIPADPNANNNIISDLAFSPDGKMLAVAYGRFRGLLQDPDPGQSIVWDVSNGKQLVTFNSYQDGVSSVDFSGDGKLLATGSYDGTVQIWRVSDWSRQVNIKVIQGPVRALHFSPDGSVLAVGVLQGNEESKQSLISLYRVTTGQKVTGLKGHTDSVMCVQYSPDGQLLVSAGMDRTVRLWDIEAGTNRILTQQDQMLILSVGFSHDGHLVAAGGGLFGIRKWQFQVWNTKTGKLKLQQNGSGEPLDSVIFSPDNHWLGTASRGGKAKLLKLSTKQTIDLSQPGNKMAITPDGKLIALTEKNKITLSVFEKLIEKK
ncbi:WD40 repeat domain-containing protein [Gimesia alba]|uniref:WD40 repeat domain-containing protein n=1 Tax=Gimesia alba TaxID=2527973 RepID=UPI0018D6DFC8|nr:WD40 repeat domain-containing protein [Gimesia alba]